MQDDHPLNNDGSKRIIRIPVFNNHPVLSFAVPFLHYDGQFYDLYYRKNMEFILRGGSVIA
jgi:hypothetical protein